MFACPLSPNELFLIAPAYYGAPSETLESTTVFHIRGTDPANSEQVVYACVGFPMAHAKAAELRMSGYKDVVTSMAPAADQTASPTA